MFKKFLPIVFCLACLSIKTIAQDSTDMLKQFEHDSAALKTTYIKSTFKTTRIINGHSVETTAPGVLDVRIDHRFGYVSGGGYEFFGLDQSNVRIGFDYGLTKTVMVGIGHTANQKTYDFLVKWKILRQSTGKVNMPVTVDYVPTFAINTLKTFPANQDFSNRLSLANVLIIGRKFSDNLSLQIMPAYIIKDKILNPVYNNCVAVGVGGRQKISKHTSVTAEYYYQLPGTKEPGTSNVLSVGVDIETGGHVFQIHLTNTQGMTDKDFIAGTTGKWSSGNIGLGFNLSRVFNVSAKSKNRPWE